MSWYCIVCCGVVCQSGQFIVHCLTFHHTIVLAGCFKIIIKSADGILYQNPKCELFPAGNKYTKAAEGTVREQLYKLKEHHVPLLSTTKVGGEECVPVCTCAGSDKEDHSAFILLFSVCHRLLDKKLLSFSQDE